MKYQSGGAFRRALEDRLRTQSIQSGIALVRLRKMVAFDRFFARLMLAQPGAWVLKGGLALQLRLGERARTTKDMDVLLTRSHQDTHQLLMHAATLDVGDWFQFEVARPRGDSTGRFGGLRFHTSSLLDGRIFEQFHIDVGVGDPIIEPVESLAMPALLDFANVPSTVIPCYPLTQQIAEKVHAFTRPRPSGESGRVKDLVDILLMAGLGGISGPMLLQAIQATFDVQGTHPFPKHWPDPPLSWATTFRNLALKVDLGYSTLTEAGHAARCFLAPVLQGEAMEMWDPVIWAWRP